MPSAGFGSILELRGDAHVASPTANELSHDDDDDDDDNHSTAGSDQPHITASDDSAINSGPMAPTASRRPVQRKPTKIAEKEKNRSPTSM